MIRRLLTVLFPSTPTCQICAHFAGRGYCTNAQSSRYGHTVTPRDGCGGHTMAAPSDDGEPHEPTP
jgi:hypothetical protein